MAVDEKDLDVDLRADAMADSEAMTERNKVFQDHLKTIRETQQAELELFAARMGTERMEAYRQSQLEVAAAEKELEQYDERIASLRQQLAEVDKLSDAERKRLEADLNDQKKGRENAKKTADVKVKQSRRVKKALEEEHQTLEDLETQGYETTASLLGVNTALGTFMKKLGTKGGFKAFGKGILRALNPLNLLMSVFGKIIEMTIAVTMEIDNAAAAFRKSTGASYAATSGIMNQADAMKTSGVDAKELFQAHEALYRTMVDYTKASPAQQASLRSTTAYLQELGVSAQTTADIANEATKNLGYGFGEVEGVMRQVAGVADGLKRPFDLVAKDFATVSKKLAFYGKNIMGTFKKLSAQSKSTGLSVDQLLGVVEQFDTFEGAGKAVGKLNAIMGGPYLNSIDMLNAEEGERVEILKRSMKQSGMNFKTMGKYEQKMVASTLGVSVDEARKLFGAETEQQKMEALKKGELAKRAKEAQSLQELAHQAMKSMSLNILEHLPAIRKAITWLTDKIVEGLKWFQSLNWWQKLGVATGLTAIAALLSKLPSLFTAGLSKLFPKWFPKKGAKEALKAGAKGAAQAGSKASAAGSLVERLLNLGARLEDFPGPLRKIGTFIGEVAIKLDNFKRALNPKNWKVISKMAWLVNKFKETLNPKKWKVVQKLKTMLGFGKGVKGAGGFLGQILNFFTNMFQAQPSKILKPLIKSFAAIGRLIGFIGTKIPFLGAIIALVIGAIEPIWNKVKSFVANIKKLFSGDIKGFLKGFIGETLDTLFLLPFRILLNAVDEFVNGFIWVFNLLFGWLGLKIPELDLSGLFDKYVSEPLMKAWNWLFDTITGSFGELWDSFKKKLSALGSWVAGIGKTIWGGFTAAMKGIWAAVKWVFSKIGGFIKDVFGALKQTFDDFRATGASVPAAIGAAFMAGWDVIKNSFNSLVDVGVKAWERLKEGAGGVWTSIKEMFSGGIQGLLSIFDLLGAGLAKAWELVSSGAIAVWNAISGGARKAWDFVSGGAKAGFGATAEAGASAAKTLSDTWNSTTDAISGLWDRTTALIQAKWDTTIGLLNAKWDTATGIIKAKWTAVTESVVQSWDTTMNKIIERIEPLVSGMSAAMDQIANLWQQMKDKMNFDGLPEKIKADSHKIVVALMDGFQQAWDELYAGLPAALQFAIEKAMGAVVMGRKMGIVADPGATGYAEQQILGSVDQNAPVQDFIYQSGTGAVTPIDKNDVVIGGKPGGAVDNMIEKLNSLSPMMQMGKMLQKAGQGAPAAAGSPADGKPIVINVHVGQKKIDQIVIDALNSPTGKKYLSPYAQ